MFAKKVLFEQYRLHRPGGRKKTEGFTGKTDKMFQHDSIVHRVSYGLSLGKRGVAGH